MNLDPKDFPDVESIEVTIVEETPDGKRYVTYYGSISDIPEWAPASVGSAEARMSHALDLSGLVSRACSEGLNPPSPAPMGGS